MRFYRACVQKHVYVYGADKRFLSKNASFSGMAESLLEAFPDARIMSTTRDPKKTVPSQLSSIKPGLVAVGFDRISPALCDCFVEQLLFYYLHLEALARARPDRVAIIDNDELRDNLEAAVQASFAALELDISPQFARALAEAGRRSRGFSSRHAYTLAEYGLSESTIEKRFDAVYRSRTFGRSGISATDV